MSATDGWLETYRGTVFRWEVDNNDHLTVAYYFARIGDAGLALVEAAGFDRRVWATVDCYVRYRHELRVGDIMHMASGVIAADADRLLLGHKLLNSETGELCTTVEQELRRVPSPPAPPVRVPEGRADAAAARTVAWDGPPRDRRPQPATLDGFLDAARDTVKPWEIDVTGQSALSALVHRFSAANAHAIAAFGLTPAYLRDARRGFSTFEFQLVLPPPARAESPGLRPGDPVVVRSGLVHVGTSSLRVVHVMLHAGTGARVATLEQFGVHLDLEARRPAPLPPALRDRARAVLVAPGPGP